MTQLALTFDEAEHAGMSLAVARHLILSKVRPDANGCWIPRKATTAQGYMMVCRGTAHLGTRWSEYMHRLSHEAFIGPIPHGYHVDHLCRVRACCNPKHLEAVTPLENARRSTAGLRCIERARAQTHCLRGHPFDENNTRRVGERRICKACRLYHSRKSYKPRQRMTKKTHCLRGHLFAETQLILRDGTRQCRECNRMRDAARRKRAA